MIAAITVRAADRPDDTDRLREFAAARGREQANTLERHLAQPRYRPALTRVAARDGELLGYASIAHQRLRLGAATLDTGVVAPFVLRDPEDAELFAVLIGDCLGTLLDQGLPLVTLIGASEQHALFGFAPYRFESAVELRALANAAGAKLRAAAAGDLDDLSALYQASYDGLALIDDRASPDWRDWAELRRALVLEDSRGRLVAYAALAAAQSPAALAIDEAAAADAGAARTLCAALLELAREQDRSALLLRLPPWHSVAQAALHLGGTARIGAPAATDQLAGVVDLPGVLEALAPEFERRLARSRYAGWSGNLRVEIETERVTLAFERGIATVIDGSRPPDLRLRHVELAALAQLCLGYRAAADLRATGGLACDDSALGLIDALFPTVFATH